MVKPSTLEASTSVSAVRAVRSSTVSLGETSKAGLTVRVDEDGDALVISPLGELDMSSAKTLEEELRRAVSSDASAIFLDLGGVGFIDSSGLRALLVAAKLSEANGRRFRILGAPESLRQMIEVTGLKDSLAA